MSVYNCVSSFYVETQIDQFEARFGANTALHLSSIFNLAFPIGGRSLAGYIATPP